MGNRSGLGGDMMQGTLDMLILKALSRKSMHGYAITELIQGSSANVLRVEEGALYPALHRLELRGLLKSEWGLSTVGAAAAVPMTHWLGSFLYGIKPTDPLTFSAAGLVLMAVAVLATLAPALRATRIAPVTALRDE